MQTVKELKEIARKMGIIGYSKLRKADLEKIIKKYKNYKPCKCNQYRDPVTNRCRNNTKIAIEWLMYTKNGCSYCEKAKKALSNLNASYKSIEVKEADREKLYAKIDKSTGSYRSFPIIFKEKKFIGGFSELEKLLKQT